ncbi:hypothetical protein [Agarilytica rhodophyticola]|uniref:hypothetical protein n=1 Tax=Agarilytica rhodophyticola TaxID=1737490 RepID=UPI000B349EBF|nr:hypothetical protein [Agarilytica rhodophyticola]
MEIIDANSGATQAFLDRRYNDQCISKREFGKTLSCPWVKVGNLYLSVTYTGEESWTPLVEHLQKQKDSKFTILGGRHGQHEGARVDPKTGKIIPKGCFDPELHTQDCSKAKVLVNKHNYFDNDNPRVIDVGKPPYDKTHKIKEKILSELRLGRIVVLAWCYSIFAMEEIENWTPKQVQLSHAILNTNKTIAAIVKESFGWVPR